MKKNTLLTISAAVLLVAISACQRAQPAQTPRLLMLGKWTMVEGTTNTVFTASYMQVNNHKDTTRFTQADYFNFKADSTVDIMEGGVSHNGKWKMVGNDVIFTNTNYMDVPLTGWEFPILNGTKLEFYHYDVLPSVATEFKLDFKR